MGKRGTGETRRERRAGALMTTYLLLALSGDGTSRAYISKRGELFGLGEMAEVLPTTTGNDRGSYQAYDVDHFSIDVMRLEV